MRVHYRAPLNFTWEGMEEARQALARIDEWLARIREVVAKKIDNGKNKTRPGEQFEEALDDDLNISAALGFLFESIRETNRAMDQNEMDAATANAWLKWWERVNSVLRLERQLVLDASSGRFTLEGGDVQMIHLPSEIAKLAEERAQARLAKDFQKSDELRDELSARGWEIRDTKDGQKLARRAGA